jgi:hypothetical protein
MEALNVNKLLSKLVLAEKQQLCPECGARMTEFDRRRENGAIFVWYRCSRDDCAGQWLQKMSLGLPELASQVV